MTTSCPQCGHLNGSAATCANCGHALANGVSHPTTAKPPPPPEVANWVIHKVPPEIAEEFRRTFNEEEFLAELRETERTGGNELKDFIRELEQVADQP